MSTFGRSTANHQPFDGMERRRVLALRDTRQSPNLSQFVNRANQSIDDGFHGFPAAAQSPETYRKWVGGRIYVLLTMEKSVSDFVGYLAALIAQMATE